MQPDIGIPLTAAGWTFNHLGVAVADIQKALAFYTQAFGYVPLTDVYRDEIQQVSVTFIGPPQDFSDRRAKAFVLELIEPATPESHLHRLLKSGGGAYHVCYAVPEINEAVARLTAHGALKVRGPDPAIAYFDKPIAWCYTPARHLIELVQLD